MGRRVSVGVLPGGLGQLSIDQNTLRTVDLDADLTLTADGTGIIRVLKNTSMFGSRLSLENNGEVFFKEGAGSGNDGIALKAPQNVTSNYTITLPPAVAATNGLVLSSTTAGVTSWSRVSYINNSVNTSFQATNWNSYFVDTSAAGPVTATLPGNPSIGDTVRFFDVTGNFDNDALTVAGNGNLIMGQSNDMVVDSINAAFELIFSGQDNGWRIFSV